MSIFFADTSALAKRYVPEVGSAWVQSWIDSASGHVTLISALSTVEFIALLARRQREGHVSAADFNRVRLDFLFHVRQQYRVIALRQDVLGRAQLLVAQHPLRTLDAIQLAAAHIAANALGTFPIFATADQKLLTVAAAEGFPTDDPNALLNRSVRHAPRKRASAHPGVR